MKEPQRTFMSDMAKHKDLTDIVNKSIEKLTGRARENF